MYQVVSLEVFPFIKSLHGDGTGESASSYARHMKDAVFMVPSPAVLASVVEQLDELPMEDRDTKGDLYEYMLSKLSTAGQNGQFRTPRHIIRLMVDLVAPTPTDTICDPACGTAGFLVSAVEYLHDEHGDLFHDAEQKEHFNRGMFHGFDFDQTMLRIGSMNMMLHGVEGATIERRDSLAEETAHVADEFSLVLANPPFKGSLDYDATAKNLLSTAKTKKTELLFLVQILRILQTGGRAAVIVPDGVLFGSSKAHKAVRKALVEDHRLEAVISMPSGVFKPYAGVSTAILLFTKTGAGGTDDVWFYEMRADGFSLDDKRQPVDDERPPGHPRPLAGPGRRGGAGADGPELPRAEEGHRGAGLRPLVQPVPGGGVRGGRVRPAGEDPRRPPGAGGGDPGRPRRAGGAGGMTMHEFGWPTVPLGELCDVVMGRTPSRSEPSILGRRPPLAQHLRYGRQPGLSRLFGNDHGCWRG